MEEFMIEDLRNLPKAELHVHLEGSVEPETCVELEPKLTLEEARAYYRHSDFSGFLECFKWVAWLLRTPRDYALVTRRLLAGLREENVRYAEITLSAGVVLWKGQDFAAVYDAVRAASCETGIEVRWILDAVRQFGPEHAFEVARLAAERVDEGVIAFGIGGDEAMGPPEWFTEVYSWAGSQGLRLTAHAGETAGPASIWGALALGAQRIGHGVRAMEDPNLIDHLRDNQVPLEVCISSNVATGAVRSLHEHPVRRLYDAGVPMVLNTDDPAIFGTSLSREYEIARNEFGFSDAELRRLAEDSFRYAFNWTGSSSTSRT